MKFINIAGSVENFVMNVNEKHALIHFRDYICKKLETYHPDIFSGFMSELSTEKNEEDKSNKVVRMLEETNESIFQKLTESYRSEFEVNGKADVRSNSIYSDSYDRRRVNTEPNETLKGL